MLELFEQERGEHSGDRIGIRHFRRHWNPVVADACFAARQAAARNRAARVLAMELLPTVKDMHEDLARALEMGWNDPNHIDAHVLQQRRIGAPDVLEGALNRLAVLDEETIRPILGMLSAIREYHRLQSVRDMRHLVDLVLAGELAQRRSFLGDACRHAGEAGQRLDAVAMWKVSPNT